MPHVVPAAGGWPIEDILRNLELREVPEMRIHRARAFLARPISKSSTIPWEFVELAASWVNRRTKEWVHLRATAAQLHARCLHQFILALWELREQSIVGRAKEIPGCSGLGLSVALVHGTVPRSWARAPIGPRRTLSDLMVEILAHLDKTAHDPAPAGLDLDAPGEVLSLARLEREFIGSNLVTQKIRRFSKVRGLMGGPEELPAECFEGAENTGPVFERLRHSFLL